MADGDIIVRDCKRACYFLNYYDKDFIGDCIEKVLNKYLTHFKGEVGTKDFYWWVYKVCKHLLVDKLKSEKKIDWYSYMLINDPCDNGDLMRKIWVEDKLAEIERRKVDLSPLEIKVLDGRINGEKFKEIAEKNGTSLSAALVTFDRVKRKLNKNE